MGKGQKFIRFFELIGILIYKKGKNVIRIGENASKIEGNGP